MSEREASMDAFMAELEEFLRIPSISSGGGDAGDLDRAADWLCERIESAGGTSEKVAGFGNPLVVGELRARDPEAPTVMIYGHYDVQSPDPVESWTSPPFEPTIRGDRLYARGASDDKGNFLPLLHVACRMAKADELPVNIRVLVEGEEEVGGDGAARWFMQDERGADCVIVFDSSMLDEKTPALTVGARGIIQLHVHVKTAERDLHSGLYGGSVLNAGHVLHKMVSQVMPGPDGLLREELREGRSEPLPEDLDSWNSLPPGQQVIAEAGANPIDPKTADLYYLRNWADASMDLNGFATGDAQQRRTIVPAEAKAVVSVRLAPGQSAEVIRQRLEELLMSAAPQGAEVTMTGVAADPALFDASSEPLQLAAQALESACGKPPVFVRVGGSIPILAAFAQRGIQAVVSGFALPDDAVHAPDESFRLQSLELGLRASEELYAALARLKG